MTIHNNVHNEIKVHKGVDIAREAPRLIVSATNEPLASIIVVQTYYTLGWPLIFCLFSFCW